MAALLTLPGPVVAVIGDGGCGKSGLINSITGSRTTAVETNTPEIHPSQTYTNTEVFTLRATTIHEIPILDVSIVQQLKDISKANLQLILCCFNIQGRVSQLHNEMLRELQEAGLLGKVVFVLTFANELVKTERAEKYQQWLTTLSEQQLVHPILHVAGHVYRENGLVGETDWLDSLRKACLTLLQDQSQQAVPIHIGIQSNPNTTKKCGAIVWNMCRSVTIGALGLAVPLSFACWFGNSFRPEIIVVAAIVGAIVGVIFEIWKRR